MTKQISALDAFLKADAVSTEEVPVPRLGVSITLQTISPDSFNAISAEVTDKKGAVDTLKLFTSFIAESETSGLFQNAELMEKVDAMSPTECVSKTLRIGEIMLLGAKVQELSGFDNSAKITEAKN